MILSLNLSDSIKNSYSQEFVGLASQDRDEDAVPRSRSSNRFVIDDDEDDIDNDRAGPSNRPG